MTILPHILRIALGLILLLFLPGFCLQVALFDREAGLQRDERVALSFALSLVLVSITALILNNLPGGLSFDNILISLLLTSLLSGTAAILRYRKFLRHLIGCGRLCWNPLWRWCGQIKFSYRPSRIWLLNGLALLLGIGGLLAGEVLPGPGEHYTEFYLLGAQGRAESYPREATLGQPVEVIVGIANHEGEARIYHVKVYQGERLIGDREGILVQEGEPWEEFIPFIPVRTGGDELVKFILYQESSQEPYRELVIQIDVKN